jgi:hypothetical protein
MKSRKKKTKTSPSTSEQVAPVKNNAPAVWDLVVADMQARDKVGFERYGTRLQAFNQRNAPVDAYQELLDLTVYLRQWIAEREEIIHTLKHYADESNYSHGYSCESMCGCGPSAYEAQEILKRMGVK